MIGWTLNMQNDMLGEVFLFPELSAFAVFEEFDLAEALLGLVLICTGRRASSLFRKMAQIRRRVSEVNH